jgi:hypothetical protein
MSTPQEIHDRARGEALLELERAGRAPHPDSPAGKKLLASYERWQAAQALKASDVKAMADLAASLKAITVSLDAAKAATVAPDQGLSGLAAYRKWAAKATTSIAEDRATDIAAKAMRSSLKRGGTVPVVVAEGFKVYKAEGGKLTKAAWTASLQSTS